MQYFSVSQVQKVLKDMTSNENGYLILKLQAFLIHLFNHLLS
jgi:hypothetical protein